MERYQELNRRLADAYVPRRERLEGEPPSLFDAHLLLPFEMSGTKALLGRLWDNPIESGRFLQNALLYDRIYVPTVDLLVLVQLITTIGPRNLIQSLESGAIVLVCYRGAIGYIGNGNGLGTFEIRSNQGQVFREEHDRTWASTDDVLKSLGEQFASEDSVLKDDWPEIARLVRENVVDIDSAEFTPVAEATYRDVLGNPWLQAFFTLEQRTDLKRISGVGPDQMRWLGQDRLNDDVDRLLHLAQFNFETYMAEKVGALDQTSGSGARPLLVARAERRVANAKALQGFGKVLDLNRVPDFSGLHNDDEGVNRLWRLRTSREAVEFRRWFHENVRDKPNEAERLFVDTLGKQSLGDKFSVKALRFVAFGVAPGVLSGVPQLAVAGGAIGLAASVVDSFLIDRFLRPRGPKLMIDRLRGILPAEPPA